MAAHRRSLKQVGRVLALASFAALPALALGSLPARAGGALIYVTNAGSASRQPATNRPTSA